MNEEENEINEDAIPVVEDTGFSDMARILREQNGARTASQGDDEDGDEISILDDEEYDDDEYDDDEYGHGQQTVEHYENNNHGTLETPPAHNITYGGFGYLETSINRAVSEAERGQADSSPEAKQQIDELARFVSHFGETVEKQPVRDIISVVDSPHDYSGVTEGDFDEKLDELLEREITDVKMRSRVKLIIPTPTDVRGLIEREFDQDEVVAGMDDVPPTAVIVLSQARSSSAISRTSLVQQLSDPNSDPDGIARSLLAFAETYIIPNAEKLLRPYYDAESSSWKLVKRVEDVAKQTRARYVEEFEAWMRERIHELEEQYVRENPPIAERDYRFLLDSARETGQNAIIRANSQLLETRGELLDMAVLHGSTPEMRAVGRHVLNVDNTTATVRQTLDLLRGVGVSDDSVRVLDADDSDVSRGVPVEVVEPGVTNAPAPADVHVPVVEPEPEPETETEPEVGPAPIVEPEPEPEGEPELTEEEKALQEQMSAITNSLYDDGTFNPDPVEPLTPTGGQPAVEPVQRESVMPSTVEVPEHKATNVDDFGTVLTGYEPEEPDGAANESEADNAGQGGNRMSTGKLVALGTVSALLVGGAAFGITGYVWPGYMKQEKPAPSPIDGSGKINQQLRDQLKPIQGKYRVGDKMDLITEKGTVSVKIVGFNVDGAVAEDDSSHRWLITNDQLKQWLTSNPGNFKGRTEIDNLDTVVEETGNTKNNSSGRVTNTSMVIGLRAFYPAG